MAAGIPLYRATRITDINEVTNIQRLSYKPQIDDHPAKKIVAVR